MPGYKSFAKTAEKISNLLNETAHIFLHFANPQILILSQLYHIKPVKFIYFLKNTKHRLLKFGSEKNGTTQHSQGQTHRRRTIYFHKAHQWTIVLKTHYLL
jgi:hypothetical protein